MNATESCFSTNANWNTVANINKNLLIINDKQKNAHNYDQSTNLLFRCKPFLPKYGLSLNLLYTKIHWIKYSITINLNNSLITSQTQMKVLCVMFDNKLEWTNQVGKTIWKAKKSFHALKLIKPFFTNHELKQLITSNYYSVLYHKSEIWHIPTLNYYSK